MAVTGFTWYQGESNTNAAGVREYACRFPAMISAWREAFKVPKAYFGFIQLSTWCATLVPEMRATQMQAFEKLENIGYATNADHGAGCNIHPPPKQFCGYRLGDSALKIVYDFPKAWQSPNMTSQTFVAGSGSGSAPSAIITVESVSETGLTTIAKPYNEGTVDCKERASDCAWASLKLSDGTWADAAISVNSDRKGLTFKPARNVTAAQTGAPTATAYGWGANPMMTVYDAETDLPLLPWNSDFVPYTGNGTQPPAPPRKCTIHIHHTLDCFNNADGTLILPHLSPAPAGAALSLESCATACYALQPHANFTVAGVAGGKSCFCGAPGDMATAAAKARSVDKTQCTGTPCGGNGHETECGGPGRLLAYSYTCDDGGADSTTLSN